MDADIISYEAMLAAKDSAGWAFWAMCGTWFSGVVTLFAACVALKAMGVWKLQERRSEKKALKTALINYRNLAIVLPPWIDPKNPEVYREAALASQNSINQIWSIVTLMEIDLAGTDEIGSKFLELNDAHNKYLSGEVEHNQVMSVLFDFMVIPFVNNVK
ncbi:hypothetical protein RDT67_20230 [Serratia fonticola]|uniref:Uncharacterized protein n=1 Tax=Serratia fonticola TaxID=47917 RepID=A0AAJ1YID1_SERFO|nr:hypothetical protein [Serratia fonticola]MDQ9128750.1 hypothetical protein [Serratia fonticola]